MQFQDKVCVVTGAGNGIGRATALEMDARGGKVVLSDVNDESGESAAAELRDAGGEAVYVHADMRSNDDILALMDDRGEDVRPPATCCTTTRASTRAT